MDTYRIAVIPGDGIGKETVPEGLRVEPGSRIHHPATDDHDVIGRGSRG